MKLNIFFRRLPPSPALHRYALSRLKLWETEWKRILDLRLTIAQEGDQIRVDLIGRDEAGHAISAQTRAADEFKAIDALYRKLSPQGQLLSHQRPAMSATRSLMRTLVH